MIELYMMIIICSDWIFNTEKLQEREDYEWRAFFFWLFIEFCFFISYIFCSACFLFIRAFIQNPYELGAADSFNNKLTDFLDANILMMGFICLVSSPAFVSVCIWILDQSLQVLISTEVQTVFLIIMGIQVFQTVSMMLITFTTNHIYFGNDTYNEWVPYFLYIAQYAIFLVLPLVSTGFSIFARWQYELDGTIVGPWFTFIAF